MARASAKRAVKTAKPASRKASAKSKKTDKKAKSRGPALGDLPGWNLADLYPGIDSPELKRDLDRVATECVAFETDYKGKLAELAAAPGAPGLLAAIKRYEALDDVLGRIGSYAGLLYATDSTDPVTAKFYGDMNERITADVSHLLFFDLELNRIDDAVLDAAMRDGPLAHYRPWLEDVRKEKPYQLEDRVELLFHEKSVTGRAAWNRLFDETMAGHV